VKAWRTALNVITGEANIYLGKGTPPARRTRCSNPNALPGWLFNGVFNGEKTGNDACRTWRAMTLVRRTLLQFWAQWLPTAPARTVTIGAEGYRYFQNNRSSRAVAGDSGSTG
jgi:hypothetical protein